MIIQHIDIDHIPAILWGEDSDKLFIAVHGNMSSKSDTAIEILAEEAVALGYQVLSFDLPKHGDRKEEDLLCKVQCSVPELTKVMEFAQGKSKEISLFACSMGAYFSLLAYHDTPLRKCLFLAPVVDMKRIITNMMTWFSLTEEMLEEQKELPTPIGETLYWDYYCYVKKHPINQWNHPTAILYGEKDELCEFTIVQDFAQQFDCSLTIVDKAGHYFHTTEELTLYRNWLNIQLSNIY